MRFYSVVGCLVVLFVSVGRTSGAKEVANFALLDLKGRYHELRQAEAKAVVLFFTANGCPVARQSIPRLRDLQKHFENRGVSFWMINSNSGDDRESMNKEA